MSIAFHQNTQQQRPQPHTTEDTSDTEQNESFVDSVQSSAGLDIGPALLIGAFIVVIVLIGLLVKFAKPKEEIETETAASDALASNNETKEQAASTEAANSPKTKKTKKKTPRRQRKNQK